MKKQHDYYDLKLGSIEQYCMLVPKSEKQKWRALGWRTYKEIGLPQWQARAAYLMYGWLSFRDILMFNRPKMLVEQSVIGQKIVGFCTHLGTYGMGGAGFFGLLLDNQEYLVYAVWGAGEFILLDNRPIQQPHFIQSETMAWLNQQDEDGTALLSVLQNAVIRECVLTDETCRLQIEKDGVAHVLEYLCQDSRLNVPDFSDEQQRQRVAFDTGKIADYLLFQHENGTLIV